MRRSIRILVGLVLVAGLLGSAAWVFTPWPRVLLIRYAFGQDAERRNAALAEYSTGAVEVRVGIPYGDAPRERFDLYLPAGEGPHPVVIWIHGGGFVAGDRSDLSGYLRLLADRGVAAIALGYTRAPEARYPVPVQQAARALQHLNRAADILNIDMQRHVIAGDSAGAQIAGQLAAALTDPAYGETLGIAPPQVAPSGVVLFCGIYDPTLLTGGGAFAGFVETAVWSYFGQRDIAGDPRLAQMAVQRHVTPAFPPSFVSVGNGDPLAPQSAILAESIAAKGVEVDRLFFEPDRQPPLGHEYQFDLSDPAGLEALARLTGFLDRVLGASAPGE
ncbi:alpha/beta hydrolase [Halovulum dunhuangense]|uniref:Alpha/beta hydrolase n=1 Tax=Halovulum dunhuangense TaxID=1505036 RepID=A0A849L2H9_9RHOB|nr:alpha/beta hydrolase [Halovulum dunhuangense]NNU80526.1 alpha/beta hydrolase [Halovulum dunhuangense]